jgi:hypothetical protein
MGMLATLVPSKEIEKNKRTPTQSQEVQFILMKLKNNHNDP